MTRRCAIAATVALIPLAACGGSLGASSPNLEFGPTSGGGGAGFLDLISDAQFVNAFRGTRRVTLQYDGNLLEYLEDVGSDGRGKFSVDATTVFSSMPDEELFLELQDLHQVLSFRYRDWRIRDLNLFLQNYKYGISDLDTVVAGIACVQIEVVRDAPDARSRYFVDVDPTTGLVLRWEEQNLAGDMLAHIEFETFEYDGSLDGLELIERHYATTQHSLDDDLEAVFGFEPLVPDVGPASGLQVMPIVEKMLVGSDSWARVYMTDGLEMAILLSGAPEGPGPFSGVVRHIEVGTWSALEGEIGGQRLISAGKFHPDDLALMLQSAL